LLPMMSQEDRWSPPQDLVELLGECVKHHWVEHQPWRFGQLPEDVAREATRVLWEEQCAGGEETWPSEEEEEEQHGARKRVPGGSEEEEEVGLDGQREVGIVEGH
jgi:hypothetical protein